MSSMYLTNDEAWVVSLFAAGVALEVFCIAVAIVASVRWWRS